MIRCEYEIIHLLREVYLIGKLFRIFDVSRSGYYKWISRTGTVSSYKKRRDTVSMYIKQVHSKFKTYGYRRIADKIKRDLGLEVSYYMCHKCCRELNIVSKARKSPYRKPGRASKVYKNLMLGNWKTIKPFEVVCSDSTIIKHKGRNYDLNMYVDVFNNEIVGFDLDVSNFGQNKRNHMKALHNMLEEKVLRGYGDTFTTIHSDQGSIYTSNSYEHAYGNHLIKRSMSRRATPTDNPIIESLNGWIKDELVYDFDSRNCKDIYRTVKRYIDYYNNERSAYKLGYMTPVEYRQRLGFL